MRFMLLSVMLFATMNAYAGPDASAENYGNVLTNVGIDKVAECVSTDNPSVRLEFYSKIEPYMQDWSDSPGFAYMVLTKTDANATGLQELMVPLRFGGVGEGIALWDDATRREGVDLQFSNRLQIENLRFAAETPELESFKITDGQSSWTDFKCKPLVAPTVSPDRAQSIQTDIINICARGNIAQVLARAAGSQDCKSVSEKALAEIPKLSFIGYADFDLGEITTDTFAGMTSLQALDLDLTNIAKIDEGAFANLKSLKYLSIARMRDGFTTLPQGVFRGLDSLQFLSLGDFLVTDLPDGIFDNLPNLLSLNLAYAGANSISNDLFKGLPKLIELHVTNRSLVAIAPQAFAQLGELRMLEIKGGNKSTFSVYDGQLQALGHLKSLSLFGAELPKLTSGVLNGLGSLEFLDLTANDVAAIDDAAFAGSPSLQFLNLKYNSLKSVSRAQVGLPASVEVVGAAVTP